MDRRSNYPPRQGQGGPPQNEALNKFKELIKTRGFADDEVMKLSENLGKSLGSQQQARGEREGKENTRTQLRKFYNLVRVANTSASAQGTSEEAVKVKLRTLQAQVAYAVARRTISDDFKRFFDVAVDKVISSSDLKKSLAEFATFFEAFYAYFYFYSPQR
ncbi:MAG TPA: type III-A CRISPR-associated protein Csm2 [Blastocatellia bacterium]|nr:type III-A CRISPR-associated protein Csm2 [Blastocatellia bacterium]